MFFHVNTRNGCVVLTYSSVKHSFKSVCMSVCRCSKLQVAILARSSREMSLTVRIVWKYILSRVRVSVRPSNLCEKHPKPRGNRVASACVYFNGQWPALSPAERAITVGRQWIAITCMLATAVCVCVCVCAHMCTHACVHVHARTHVLAYARMCAWCVCNIR